jgi:hypothetical protein
MFTGKILTKMASHGLTFVQGKKLYTAPAWWDRLRSHGNCRLLQWILYGIFYVRKDIWLAAKGCAVAGGNDKAAV